MGARKGRANLALVLLGIAVFFLADLVGYGSEAGYHVGLAVAVIAGFATLAVALFSWNMATYRR